MPIRRRAWLTREGWYYLAVLAFIIGGAVLRSVNLLVVLAGMMIAPVLFNWRLVMASLMGLTLRRPLPEQILAGEPFTVEIHVENTRSWMSTWLLTVEDWIEREECRKPLRASKRSNTATWHGRLLQRLSTFDIRHLAGRSSLRAEALIPHVPARGRAIGTYRITLHRRGKYRFGPLRASTRFPLGLVQGHIVLRERGEILVTPRLGNLLPQWVHLLEADLVGDERRHPQRGVTEGDYYGLRPWQSGDSLRWIHWRTTAKLARPVVRQFERRQSRDVALVLDPWLPAAHSPHEEGLVELAISFMATAIADLTSRGHSRLSCAIAGHEAQCFLGAASPMFCREMLAYLAQLAPECDYSLTRALTEAMETIRPGTRIIVVSSRGADALAGSEPEVDLPIDPQDVVWVEAGNNAFGQLFELP